jgi:hypothetical protein
MNDFLKALSNMNDSLRPHTDLFFPVSNTDNSTQGDQRKIVQFTDNIYYLALSVKQTYYC